MTRVFNLPPFCLCLLIHESRSDNCLGLALCYFDNDVDDHFHNFHLELIKSTENALGITFLMQLDDHWKLFDISTTETDASDNFPLIESGRIDFDPQITELKWECENSLGLSGIFMQC